MADMVEVVIDSIRVSLVSQQQVILLRERHANRYLPIWIGAFEANAIQLALHEVELARPLTHDLLRGVLEVLGARLERVEITELKENTFYANLVVTHQHQVHRIDARPSDGIALAVRTHSPIYVAREVMEEAGIVPDEDLAEKEQKSAGSAPSPAGAAAAAAEAPPAHPAAPSVSDESEDEDRLSVFANFLEQLGPEPPADPPSPPPAPPDEEQDE